MTVPATARRAGPFEGNDSTTEFPFTFKVFAAADISVVVTNEAGTITPLTEGSHYSVVLNGDQSVSPGGTVTYPISGDPLADGDVLSIVGDLAYDQPLAIPGGGNFNPVALERQLDRMVVQTQQLAELAGRGIRLAVGDETDDLPAAAVRANKSLHFDSEGRPVVLVPTEGSAASVMLLLASVASAAYGGGLVGYDRDLAYAIGTLGAKLNGWTDVTDFGADPTGVELSNTAFTAAKLVSNTLYLPPGEYRLENWTCQDVRLIGYRAHGVNAGDNEQSVITGSGDLLVGANNFALEYVLVRNSAAGTRGKLITVANMDTKIGPFVHCGFGKATYHVYAADVNYAIVDAQFERCSFTDASIYSRYYLHNLFVYDEDFCYTDSCGRGMHIRSCSTARISGVFEVMAEGAVYVNSAIASDVIRSLEFDHVHFERNGDTTPSSDVVFDVDPSLARVFFNSCIFAIPSVAATDVVDCGSSPNLRIAHINCTDIAFANNAHIITAINPKTAGEELGFLSEGGSIRTTEQAIAYDGFHAAGAVTATVTGAFTATPVATPAAGRSRLVLVNDATTVGAALLMITSDGTVTVQGTSTLSTVEFDCSGGFLRGRQTGGASSRVLFFTYIAT